MPSKQTNEQDQFAKNADALPSAVNADPHPTQKSKSPVPTADPTGPYGGEETCTKKPRKASRTKKPRKTSSAEHPSPSKTEHTGKQDAAAKKADAPSTVDIVPRSIQQIKALPLTVHTTNPGNDDDDEYEEEL